MGNSNTGHQQLIISAIKEETTGVKSFFVERKDGGNIQYEAGQFINLSYRLGNKEERRSYSFASSPITDTVPYFTVKRVDNGLVSRVLVDRMKVGDELTTTGCNGFFTLPDELSGTRQLFFFAAGIGITPVYSMIKSALHLHPHLSIVLVYSNRTTGEALFYKELEELAATFHERFRVVHLLSTSAQLEHARLSKELVPVLLKNYQWADHTQTLFYTCGPFAYMRMVVYALEEQHVPSTHIRKENFNPNLVTIKPKPEDRSIHLVHLQWKGTVHQIETGYPDTILQSAQKAGVTLQYSCLNGVCGSCAMRCTRGKVWHSNNEVLTDVELNSGIILTCTGYATGGDIWLEL
jgi:ferredoxin-NADP reductase